MPPKRTPASVNSQPPRPETPEPSRGKPPPGKTAPARKDLTPHLSPWTVKGFHNPPANAFTAEQLAKLDPETRKRMWDRFPDKTSDELHDDALRLHAYLCK